MTFLTPALLGGVLLVGIPIVLHLVMRREPQQVMFPALRFIQSRRASNQTRLRLRHLILLALRCLAIALLAIALARPTLPSTGRRAGAEQPLAIAMVLDNSLRMQYLEENRTRLEQAQELTDWLLEQLPPDAPVAILDRSGRGRGFSIDRDAAALRVSRLQAAPEEDSLDELIRQAAELLAQQAEHRREIYVLTDLARVSWSDEALIRIRDSLATFQDTALYLIDVGATQPRNVGLGLLELATPVLTVGSDLEIVAPLVATGTAAAEASVQLVIGGRDETPVKRGEQVVRLAGESTAQARFTLSGLDVGTYQGVVQLVSDDPLPGDNQRYFTVIVRRPRDLLLVADRPEHAAFVRQAIAPDPPLAGRPAQYACQTIRDDQLTSASLADFDAVLLLDPPGLPPLVWESLLDYVKSGGGLGLFFGRRASAALDALNQPAPQALLPGPLEWQSRNATYLRPLDYNHPILASLRDYADVVPWSTFPVFRYWELGPLAEEVHVVAGFADGQPAILERPVGAGHVLVLTTPLSDLPHDRPWNLLPTGPDPWPFLVLAGGLTDYLSGSRDERVNYQAGQSAVLPIPSDLAVRNYVLQTPSGDPVRQSIVAGRNEIVIGATTAVGNYRVQAGGENGSLDKGFSVNSSAEISQLERADAQEIVAALGPDRVQVARSRDEIEIRVGLGRVGRELYPWFILPVVVALALEHLLANRFYAASD